MWEYHFKSLIVSLIDDHHCQFDEEIKLSLTDLEKIQNKKTISAGRIFVSTKSLQNLESVDKIMSNLLNISFLKELQKKYPEYVNIKIVKDCLEKRHQLIHEMKKFVFTKQQINDYAVYMMLFQIQSAQLCSELTSEKSTESKPFPTVQIVDDDKPLVKLMEQVVNEMGFEMISSSYDGKSAIDDYQKSLPDIVLLDVAMPEYDGLYALEHIKKINKDAKVILVTGDITKSTKSKALKLGASAILYKPFEVGILHSTLEKVLTKKQPMIVEKRKISKKLQEQMLKENVEIWTKRSPV